MPRISAKEARKIVDQAFNPGNTPFAREVKPDSRGRYSVSVRDDEFLFIEATAFIVAESAKKAESKVKFNGEEDIIFEAEDLKELKKGLNQESNRQIKANLLMNFNGFQTEKYFAQILKGKESAHGQIFAYVEDDQTLANTARNNHFDLMRK